MLAIHKLSTAMEMLLHKADKFEDIASIMQTTDRETALVFADLAENFLAQVAKIHAVAVKKINEQKNSGVEIPESMQIMWNEKHSYMVNQKAMLEHKLKTLKGMM